MFILFFYFDIFSVLSMIELYVIWKNFIFTFPKKNMIKTSLIPLIYFFLLTNYSNYVAFDKALALLDQLKK